MKWLTAKRQVKVLYAVVALATTCGAAMAASDSEQFQRFKDPNQWGAPAGNLNLTRYSCVEGHQHRQREFAADGVVAIERHAARS